MRWTIAPILGLLWAGAADARDLVMVSNITSAPREYGSTLIDADTVRAVGENRTFWSYIFVRSGDDDVRGANYAEVNCAKHKIRYVKRQFFSASHALTAEIDTPTSWDHVAGESGEMKMLGLVCGTEKPAEADILGDVDPLAISDPLLNDPNFR
jgi:hypothetical protein